MSQENPKYVWCGLCQKVAIPFSECSMNESWVCPSCKEILKKIDEIRKAKGL